MKIKKNKFGLKNIKNRPLVCVQGLGFVGAAMTIAVASSRDNKGHRYFDVVGLDLPTKEGINRVDLINKGTFPFQNTDKTLTKELKKAHKEGNLVATTNSEILKIADIVVIDIHLDISFGSHTPKANFKNFKKSIVEISELIKPKTLVILETTVPPGTCDEIVLPILRKGTTQRGFKDKDLIFAHSYERVMPGPDYLNSIKKFWRVFAGANKLSERKCREFLSKIIDVKNYPLTQLSSLKASETAKILENSYRAANIAFIDEWGDFAEKIGIDMFEILDAIRYRPTHSNIRQPGFGVGGYCLTKDPLFPFVTNNVFYKHLNFSFPFLKMTSKINTQMPLRNLNRIEKILDKGLKDKKVLIMGVTYRSDVGDTRYSATETLYKEALKKGAIITLHDPCIEFWPELNLNINSLVPNPQIFDLIIFCVPHTYYKKFNILKWLKNCKPIIYDCDNVISKQNIINLRNKGYTIFSTGRGT